MANHRSPHSKPFRWLSAATLVTLVGLVAAGCGGDAKGTDINVDAPGSAGTSNSNGGGSNNSAGSSAKGGTTENGGGEGGAAEGGANNSVGTGGTGTGGTGTGGTGTSGAAGMSHAGSGTGGTSGASSGGSAGAGGNAGSANGGTTNGGSAGTAGTSNGGGAGTSGGGTAGNGGTAGSGGNSNQTCGNGTVEGTEQCDDSGPSRKCSDDCMTVASQDCVDCEQAGDCFASSDNCNGPKATPFTKDQTATCYDVLECLLADGCLKGATGTLGHCYCGTLDTAACGAAPYDLSQPGAPNGKCAALMQKGQPGVTTNSAMLGALTNKGRPAGAAGQRLNCDKNDETCAPLCNVQ